MPDKVQLAISNDFFSAFVGLPQAQQSKMARFMNNFRVNPESSGFNFEKINDAADANMRSVRIDQAYRGIILKPDRGNVYLLLWVDHHDDAYAWARRHRCVINAQTGSIQVYEATVAKTEDSTVSVTDSVVESPVAALKDRELVRLGVPEELVTRVRAITNEEELDQLESLLPQEAFEGLFYLLAGESYESIVNEREAVEESIDTTDFAAALDRSTSQMRFWVVEDDLELQSMLNAPLDKWRVFLHPTQRRSATGDKNGAVRVLGGAGTGKTVVAIHRAKWLMENLPEGGRILFTTFTANLAHDIEMNLAAICDHESKTQIEVINLDRWVSRFLRTRKYDFSIIFNADSQRFWERAMAVAPVDLDLPDAFYREEWQKVIQPQSIETLDDYKRASRIGRGTPVNRGTRVKVWQVFEEYRSQLVRDKKKEVDDAYRDAAALIPNDAAFAKYDAVLVDEAQDMGTQAFNLIRSLVDEGPNDLFIVGDGHQRIYGRNKVVLSRCGINIRGRARKLKLNYRTTEETRRWAVNLLEGYPVDDLDGGDDDNKGYRSLTHGQPPHVESFDSLEQQTAFMVNYLMRKGEMEPLSNICIVGRIGSELDLVEEGLAGADIQFQRITATNSQPGSPETVNVATMHRVKGLEYDEVILVSVNMGLVPLDVAIRDKGDAVEMRQADLEERALLYVAMTRAKKHVLVMSYGERSPYLNVQK